MFNIFHDIISNGSTKNISGSLTGTTEFDNLTVPFDDLETALESGIDFVTPNEFYSSTNFNTMEGSSKHTVNKVNNEIPKWFWIDDFCNWCRFIEIPTINGFTLYLAVWDGRGNFINCQNILMVQNNFIKKIHNSLIINRLFNNITREIIEKITHPINFGEDIGQYFVDPVTRTLKTIFNDRGTFTKFGLKLDHEPKCLVHDSDFSILRPNKTHSVMSLSDVIRTYTAEGLFYVDEKRSGLYLGLNPEPGNDNKYNIIIDGCPAVTRLSNGEFFLSTFLQFRNILNGTKYEFILDKIKYIYDGDNENFFNAFCQKVFGKGDEKTINNDWLKLKKTDNSRENISDIKTASDITLNTNQNSVIGTVKNTDFSIKVSTNNSYINSDEIDVNSVLRKW